MFCTIPSLENIPLVNVQQEIDQLKDSEDPDPSPSIEYLFVLSASNSYLKKFTYIKSTDLEDDYNRMQLAIHTAKKIVALRANVRLDELNFEIMRHYGPIIVYNGSEEQNDDLKYALEKGMPDYPDDKFIILNLPKQEINTKGQFLSIKQDLPLDNVSIGIITHAYHFPRIARMLGKEAPLYPFGDNVTKYAFLVDREFLSPGIIDRINGEIERIPLYINKGDLTQDPASDIIYLRKENEISFKTIPLNQGMLLKV
jgi:hypothetical protein